MSRDRKGSDVGLPPSQQQQRHWQACFLATKHSWKGKYRRIFAIGPHCIATLNPSTFEETNVWAYDGEFVGIAPSDKAVNEFTITTKKRDQKKTSTLTFSSDFRLPLLTEAQRFCGRFCGEKPPAPPTYNAYKTHWSDTRKETILSVRPHALVQVNSSGSVIGEYQYQDIEAICVVSDLPGGFAVFHGGTGRMHVFALDKRDELLTRVSRTTQHFLGLSLRPKKKTVTLQQFWDNRLGKYSTDVAVTSVQEFAVSKVSPRHADPEPRLFCLSELCVVERDPQTYHVVTVRPLEKVFSLVRDPKDPQLFFVEYLGGLRRQYLSVERDSLLASLLDSARATGNRHVHIQMAPTARGERFQPLDVSPDEEVESALLKFISGPAQGLPFEQALHRFNSNINYAGLVHSVTEEGWFKENKEKLIFSALSMLLERSEKTDTAEQLAGEFLAIRRLVASKAGFHAFTTLPGFKEKIGAKVVKALQRDDAGVTFAAMDALCTLMQPMHDNYDLGQEKDNKHALLGSKQFVKKLVSLLKHHADAGTSALIVSGLLDFMTFALCPPYSETTEAAQFDMLLKMLGDLGRSLFNLFAHPSLAIVKAAGMLMKSLIEEGDEEMCAKMQALSLAEGSLLRHMHTSLYTKSTDNRMLTHRQLSRHLVALWYEKNPPAQELLGRMVPAGLIDHLSSDEKVSQKDIDRMHVRDNLKLAQKAHEGKKGKVLSSKKLDEIMIHWRSKSKLKKSETPKKAVVLRRRRQRVKVDANWDYFYYQFENDHARADLIWNFKTREELREAIEGEVRAFQTDRELRGSFTVSWNHPEFEVMYESLAEEIKIGDHFLRLLLEEDVKTSKIHNPQAFFNDLYHRFLLTTQPNMKAMCLQAMAITYTKCYEEIGTFNDTEYMVTMLNRCEDRMERDRLLLFLETLLHNKYNVKRFIDAGGVRCIVDLVTLAHLHTSRAAGPSNMKTNTIEASQAQQADDEKEWYFNRGGTDAKTREGPVGFNELKELYESGAINAETRVWAQGMEGWRPLRRIPQLKWSLVATGTAVLDLSQLAVRCLDMLVTICKFYPSRDEDGAVIRPLPRCKRMLAEANCLPHIVQLLLTFEPAIVERVAMLLSIIMEDNSNMPRVHMTGVFFFIMMYTGSNILPIAHFLKQTHLYQAFQADVDTGRSILGAMLPKSMVCFLENYGAEKFASIFLGEFDTPETIWGAEMRRKMIESIALHLADFTPRLQSNTRALYEYVPIPVVHYPELENELFCNIYYLRHLCDEARFADWPIKNHVELLKDIFDAWKVEVEKKPATMSSDEAYETLGLSSEAGQQIEPGKVRKAYLKMSMKYHPDKNPEGGEMFEKISKAYMFITSRDERDVDGPDAEHLVLILRAQCILFKRHSDVLAPYKYAGYPMLMATISRETDDENLFATSVALLRAACELCYFTVKCSPLNAEELRRENGIEIVAAALSRCIDVVGRNTSEDVPAVQVITSILQCYAAAGAFEACRERIIELPQIVKDVCRCLWFKGAHPLTMAAIDCVNAFAVEEYLQNHLLHAGVLWHLVLLLFHYDFTLDESGVEKDESSNKQEFMNNHAKFGVRAIARLGGFRSEGDDVTPENPTVQNVVAALLTPYLASKLKNPDPHELLKLLNSNTQNPYLIWDNGTRAELTDFAEKQQESVVKTGEQVEDFGSGFVYSLHADELILGDVFVRIYNEQPTFVLDDPKRFTQALLDYLGREAQFLLSAETLSRRSASVSGDLPAPDDGSATVIEEPKLLVRLRRATLAMESLKHVLRANQGVESLCIGNFKLLFSLLKYEAEPKLQLLALEVISSVTANKACVADIATSDVIVYLLFAIRLLPSGRLLALQTLHALASNAKLIVEMVNRGGLVYLLDLYCNSTNPDVREATAALLSKVLSNKLHGPRVRIMLTKFLPVIFMDAMRDNPEASVTMFESTHENPELIWNEDARCKVQSVVRSMKEDLYVEQGTNPVLTWKLPDDFEVVYQDIDGEVVVGGVILRLLIKNPMWSFRKPKEFVVAIVGKFVQLAGKGASSLDARTQNEFEHVTEALVAIMHAQHDLANHVPQLGQLGRIVEPMGKSDGNINVMGACLRVLNELCSSTQCVRALGGVPCVPKIANAMKQAPPSALAPACELLKRMYEANVASLVAQAVENDCAFVHYLLKLLKEGLDTIEHSSAAKAHLVKALKAMTRDLGNGELIDGVLNKCSWWASYKEQRHDLFISSTTTAGYLTGPATTATAGYLMAAPSNSAAMASAPPPMEDAPAAAVGERRKTRTQHDDLFDD
eukprot:m.46532 g.46532  ORF g.46532 m.46532 type:complete len:2282 (+) comp11866_c0_seq1:73-6918(+)